MCEKDKIIEFIYEKLVLKKHDLEFQFKKSKDSIGYFFVDDLLPEELVKNIYYCFPEQSKTTLKKSLKENKYVSAQLNEHPKLIEEIIYAFQDKKIVELISSITKLEDLKPDPSLYAGGISMMGKDSFLNPHLDNSHDKDRKRFRALNLLYYVTPDWNLDNGGNLELWPNGPKKKPITIHAKYNRLVVMATHKKSWHSVSKVNIDRFRCCVSNYYFSDHPIDNQHNFHVTTFRGRPEQRLRDKILQFDNFMRMQLRKIFKNGIIENPHVYKNEETDKG